MFDHAIIMQIIGPNEYYVARWMISMLGFFLCFAERVLIGSLSIFSGSKINETHKVHKSTSFKSFNICVH